MIKLGRKKEHASIDVSEILPYPMQSFNFDELP